VLYVKETPDTTHWGKLEQAKDLRTKHKLPDISDLLKDLNILRKAQAYGDTEIDEADYDAEDIATRVEDYFEQVSAFCK
jgi:hypothetical protein